LAGRGGHGAADDSLRRPTNGAAHDSLFYDGLLLDDARLGYPLGDVDAAAADHRPAASAGAEFGKCHAN
jgi:hypothetical protein